VGAFGDAMDTLHRLDLVSVLRDVAQSPKPLVGICLGLQLLMSESHEFGRHKGLDIIPGTVERLSAGEKEPVKVPQVGWNRILRPAGATHDPWLSTPLAGMADGTFLYFVHSYFVRPENRDVVLTVTRYGENEFCSGVRYKNVCAFQFHPERSGAAGLAIYKNLASLVQSQNQE
jgi:glutamine amidotransferase